MPNKKKKKNKQINKQTEVFEMLTNHNAQNFLQTIRNDNKKSNSDNQSGEGKDK